LTKPARSLEFDIAGLEDLAWWIEKDRKKALRIIDLIKEIRRDPFKGIGKPEPLKHEFAGLWSRRIDQEHRLVYDVKVDKIRILACRYHY
jgi:toxin YoeB